MADRPFPPSPVIKHIIWSTPIIRAAEGKVWNPGAKHRDGSDNWPLTWADDDNMYTAYGDGYGFHPLVPEKLSMGFAVIKGDPPDFAGVNIRSNGESTGAGEKGTKASGILMVERMLYLLIRNVDGRGNQSRLGWSSDYARTWSWADWKFELLGYPTFINYGRNYAGARDDYIYIVGHDNPSAYRSADRFVLMRVHRKRITDKSSYEFFAGLDGRGNPVWSDEFAKRSATFTHPGNCCRSGINYNPGLKRYLWWQQLDTPGADGRYEGGFGVYDAPEPWGPWTTVFFTEEWDVGPGESASFPVKWMSDDGRTVYLVFSGNDAFSVRKAALIVNDS